MKKTQEQFIKEVLDTRGKISRNEALRNYITRLASRISDLEADGWEFETERVEGDYVYVVKEKPAPRPLSLGF